MESFQNNQALYDEIITTLKAVTSEQVYNSPTEFMPVLTKALASATSDKKLLDKIANGLSIMDKNAEIQRDRKGRIIYDKETKDTELVKWEESIEDYMAREVLPHIPDAAAFFEEDLGKKKPVINSIVLLKQLYVIERLTSIERYVVQRKKKCHSPKLWTTS